MTMVWQAGGLYDSDLAITRPASYPESKCRHPEGFRHDLKYGLWLKRSVGFQCGVCRDIIMNGRGKNDGTDG